jgi:hypothetical protein
MFEIAARYFSSRDNLDHTQKWISHFSFLDNFGFFQNCSVLQ